MTPLEHLAATIRDSPALAAKRDLALLMRLGLPLDGDDGAAIAHGDEYLIVCGEAIHPGFVRSNPHAAGAAAVITNVSDVRAMGGRPVGLLDMLVSPDRAHAEAVLDGLAWAAELVGVDVVGGHLTLGHEPSLSASCTGIARRPLRAANAKPGDELLAAFCLEGRYTENTPFFSSLRDRPAAKLRDDGEALVEVAESGAVHAARDVSMPGVAGSLLQLLEIAGCGATLELDRIPRPDDVGLERWLITFPSFGFLLAAQPGATAEAAEPFLARGLACAACGRLDDSGVLRLAAAGDSTALWDLNAEPLTHLDRAGST
ncbi:MAG TPA: AIR synthase related protein [Solirubrobacteraceae bacterium]|nr:AIR synthase related protein [Solirubrobacteraceae bacterium]